jgi:hypothetical protein
MVQPYETGTRITDEQMASVKVKSATQKTVASAFGQPTRKTSMKNGEVWYYDFQQINHFTSNVSESKAFEFDTKGVLVKHYKSSAPSGGNALIDAHNAKQ